MAAKEHKHLHGNNINEGIPGRGRGKECEANFVNSPGTSRHGGEHCQGNKKRK